MSRWAPLPAAPVPERCRHTAAGLCPQAQVVEVVSKIEARLPFNPQRCTHVAATDYTSTLRPCLWTLDFGHARTQTHVSATAGRVQARRRPYFFVPLPTRTLPADRFSLVGLAVCLFVCLRFAVERGSPPGVIKSWRACIRMRFTAPPVAERAHTCARSSAPVPQLCQGRLRVGTTWGD